MLYDLILFRVLQGCLSIYATEYASSERRENTILWLYKMVTHTFRMKLKGIGNF